MFGALSGSLYPTAAPHFRQRSVDMGRNGHRGGSKHRGGRRGGRGEPERSPRAPDGGGDNPGAASNPPSPADGIREMHEHDEPARQRLGAGSEPNHGDGGERPKLPPPEPRDRGDAPDGPEPPGFPCGDARVDSRYAFAARPQDGPKAKEGQRRAGKPLRRNNFWSPSPDELLGLKSRKLEPKPENKGHNNNTAGEPLGHGVVGDPPRRGNRRTQPEPPHWPLGNHSGPETQNGAKHGYGHGGAGIGGYSKPASHTGSADADAPQQQWHHTAAPAAAAAAAADPWPRGQEIRTVWPGQAPIEWPRWSPPEGPLVPWNRARWNPAPDLPPARPWPEPCHVDEQWFAPGGRWNRNGISRRTAAPWPGRGRRQFGPAYHRSWQPTQGDHDAQRRQQEAAACRAAWDNRWKAFIGCSADPIEVARCLQIGNETDWGTLYAQFVCTAPRTEVAPPFSPHASRIGKATAARLTAQF